MCEYFIDSDHPAKKKYGRGSSSRTRGPTGRPRRTMPPGVGAATSQRQEIDSAKLLTVEAELGLVAGLVTLQAD